MIPPMFGQSGVVGSCPGAKLIHLKRVQKLFVDRPTSSNGCLLTNVAAVNKRSSVARRRIQTHRSGARIQRTVTNRGPCLSVAKPRCYHSCDRVQSGCSQINIYAFDLRMIDTVERVVFGNCDSKCPWCPELMPGCRGFSLLAMAHLDVVDCPVLHRPIQPPIWPFVSLVGLTHKTG